MKVTASKVLHAEQEIFDRPIGQFVYSDYLTKSEVVSIVRV